MSAGERKQDVTVQKCQTTAVQTVCSRVNLAPMCMSPSIVLSHPTSSASQGILTTAGSAKGVGHLSLTNFSTCSYGPLSYVIGLENRMEKLEALLERVNIS